MQLCRHVNGKHMYKKLQTLYYILQCNRESFSHIKKKTDIQLSKYCETYNSRSRCSLFSQDTKTRKRALFHYEPSLQSRKPSQLNLIKKNVPFVAKKLFQSHFPSIFREENCPVKTNLQLAQLPSVFRSLPAA